MLLVVLLALAGCGASSSLTASGATTAFKEEVARHYHGTLASNDINPPEEPVVPTGDGRGCEPSGEHEWRCTAYVYANGSGPNYDVSGDVRVEGGTIHYSVHPTPAK